MMDSSQRHLQSIYIRTHTPTAPTLRSPALLSKLLGGVVMPAPVGVGVPKCCLRHLKPRRSWSRHTKCLITFELATRLNNYTIQATVKSENVYSAGLTGGDSCLQPSSWISRAAWVWRRLSRCASCGDYSRGATICDTL